ncbi:MAG: DUF6242 domain-containing protein [Flavisolibacter sp.]
MISSCKKEDTRSNLAGITSFSIKDMPTTFEVDETQQKIFNKDSLPFQTDVSSLVAVFSIVPNASVTVGSTPQVSGTTANNFSQPVVYTVTSENGKVTRQYTVNVNVAKLDPNAVAWQQVVADAGFGNFHSLAGTAYNNKLWAQGATLGAFNSFKFGSFSSDNGSNWTRLKAVDNLGDSIPKAESSAFIAFNNKLWILGGHIPGVGFSFDDVTNKVWSSTDGVNWTASVPVNAADRWSKRERIGAVVFNNKLWVIGGNPYPPFGNTNAPGAPMKDVWSSADGTTWTLASAAPAFTARTNPAVFVFKNKIWIAGGRDASKNMLNDIWNSSDGVNWTQVNSTTPFAARWGHQVVGNKDELLLVGGEDATTVLGDLWVSADEGITWTKIEAGNSRALPANFPPRTQFSMFVQDKNLWVLGGLGEKQNNTYTFRNDVWKGKLN